MVEIVGIDFSSEKNHCNGEVNNKFKKTSTLNIFISKTLCFQNFQSFDKSLMCLLYHLPDKSILTLFSCFFKRFY